MHIVHVHVRVKPEHIQAFQKATIENAQNSIKEPGIARFDVIQDLEDPSHFVLIEVYRSIEDVGKHKETDHYAKWRNVVEKMMAEPRRSVRYQNIFPDDQGWELVTNKNKDIRGK